MDKIIIEDNIPEPDYLSTRPGVQKIEGVWIPVNNKYKVECIRAIATLKKGQSFLVHSRCEYTVKDWIYMVKRRYEDRYFEIKTIKSEKPTTKIHNNHLGKIKCKQYPIRVWRVA